MNGAHSPKNRLHSPTLLSWLLGMLLGTPGAERGHGQPARQRHGGWSQRRVPLPHPQPANPYLPNNTVASVNRFYGQK